MICFVFVFIVTVRLVERVSGGVAGIRIDYAPLIYAVSGIRPNFGKIDYANPSHLGVIYILPYREFYDW